VTAELATLGPVAWLVIAAALIAAGPLLGRLTSSPLLAMGLLTAIVVGSLGEVFGKVGPLSAYPAALAVGAVTLIRSGRRVAWSPVLLATLVWYATQAISLAVAQDLSAAKSVLWEETQNDLPMLVIGIGLLSIIRRVDVVLGVAVAVLAGLAGLSAVQEFVLHDATSLGGLTRLGVQDSVVPGLLGRHSGPELDPNFWGRELLLFAPISLSLWQVRLGGRLRWLWLIAAGLLAAGEYLTQSRGGLVAMIVALFVWSAILIRNKIRLAALATALALAVVVLPGVGNRLDTLLQSSSSSVTAPADSSLQGRAEVQKAGLAMAADHPWLGVGAGNFEHAEVSYVRRLGLAALGSTLAPHNLYVQMLAETGVLGLAGWITFYVVGLLVAVRARRLWRRLGGVEPGDPALLATGVIAGLVGWGVASLFLHLADFTSLLLVMSVGVALDLQARQAADRLSLPLGSAQGLLVWAPPVLARRPELRRSLQLFTSALVLVLVTIISLSEFRPRLWTSQLGVDVILSNTSSSYAYDVLSRTTTVPTFMLVASDRRFVDAAATRLGISSQVGRQLRIAVTRQGGSAHFMLAVRSPDGQTAQDVAPAIIQEAETYLTAVGAPYRLLTTAPVELTPPGSNRRMLVEALALTLLGLASALASARQPRTAPARWR